MRRPYIRGISYRIVLSRMKARCANCNTQILYSKNYDLCVYYLMISLGSKSNRLFRSKNMKLDVIKESDMSVVNPSTQI